MPSYGRRRETDYVGYAWTGSGYRFSVRDDEEAGRSQPDGVRAGQRPWQRQRRTTSGACAMMRRLHGGVVTSSSETYALWGQSVLRRSRSVRGFLGRRLAAAAEHEGGDEVVFDFVRLKIGGSRSGRLDLVQIGVDVRAEIRP